MQTINSVSRYCGGLGVGQCIVDFGEYSQLPNTTFINTYTPIETPNAGAPHQCTWYACERINQLTGLGLSGAMGNGNTWWEGARDRGFTYYTSTTEALAAKGTLAGLVPSGVIGVSTNHVAVCERYDEDGTVYLSEMWGDADNNGTVRLCKYNISEISAYWIDFNVEASGGGGYIKKKLLEGKDFCWKSPPVEEGKGIPYQKDDMLPTKEKYGEFLKLLNDAQELAKVKEDKRINFSVEQDGGILTAKRFNQYLYLMQESKEGNLKGVDKKVEKMEDVKTGDLLKAEHFNKLAELFNHWRYGSLFSGPFKNQIWNGLLDLGFNEYAAAGIMGNMECESGCVPNTQEIASDSQWYGQGKGGYGLCQWTNTNSSDWSQGRRTNLFVWCKSNGLDPTTVEGQLKFMYHEYTTVSYYWNNLGTNFMKNSNNAGQAAVQWLAYFEGCPGHFTTGLRMQHAEEFYKIGHSGGFAPVDGDSSIDLSDLPQIRQRLVKAAQSQLGTPYVWGGTTPYVGLDCSGLIQYCYGTCGINISRTTYTQQNEIRIISRSAAQPGDVVYWEPGNAYHVAMYVGNNTVIEAPAPGQVVKYSTLYEKNSNYYFGTFFK